MDTALALGVAGYPWVRGVSGRGVDVGKASRRKKERREAYNPGPLYKLLGQYDRKSLLILLSAAASSPMSMHRLPSIQVAIAHALTVRPRGSTIAQPQDLQQIVTAASNALPSTSHLEDWVPLDPSGP